jgi:serine/threonine protein kinase
VNEVPPIVAATGLRVGEYVLDEKIGQGAFGEVWRAHHRAWTDQFAAAKIPTDPSYLRQLQSEGFSLHRLNHINIVRVLGFDPSATPPYMLTELIDGPSLRELLKDHRPNVLASIAIFRQILAGLTYAHSQGVVHGDLKPENVLVSHSVAEGKIEEGSVKLNDFGVGLVAVAAAMGTGSSSRLMRSSTSGTVTTLAYVSPEQKEGAAPDAKCDLYACGVMLFELLTGERPAGAESPSDLNPQVPRELDEVFRRAYARRDRRYATAQELLTAVETIAAKMPAPRPVPKAAPPPPLANDDTGFGIIGLRPDDEDVSESEREAEEEVPMAPPPPPPPPPRQAPVQAAPPKREPAPEPVSSVPSPPRPVNKNAPRSVAVMDELARKPLRTAGELRDVFHRVYQTRTLDQGEIGNLRIRLDQWAEAEGGLPGFGERIEVTEAIDCPYHRISVVTTLEGDGGATSSAQPMDESVILANPAAAQDCGRVLEVSDFSIVVHVSTGIFPSGFLEMINVPAIRMAVANLLTSAKTKAAGRGIVRQELKLARANVLSLRYTFETTDHGACFAGISLKVVAPLSPLTRMRDDLLKRAAILLDSENVGAGINELRQMFLTPNPAQPRAEKMLVALRAKLAAAYVNMARTSAANMGVFESLEYSARAADLLPSSEDAHAHEQQVRSRAFWIQFGPGLMIGIVFGVIASFNSGAFNYIVAGLGAIGAGIFCWFKLGTRPARTDAAFCHACLLPLAIAAILATTLKLWSQPIYDGAAIVAVAMAMVIDLMILNKYGHKLMRPPYRDTLAGAPLELLNQIQTMLEPDWDDLRKYYVALEPLYKHASAKIGAAPPAAEGAGLPQLGDPDDTI